MEWMGVWRGSEGGVCPKLHSRMQMECWSLQSLWTSMDH